MPMLSQILLSLSLSLSFSLSLSLSLTNSLEALERSMGMSGGAGSGAKRPQPATAADHRDRREKKRHAAAASLAAVVSTPTTSPSSLPAAEALYYPLPKTGTVREVLAACTRRNSSSVFALASNNFSLLETALEQLSSTTRHGAAGSEARGAALARVSEKALLLEDPIAGLASGGHEKNREAFENKSKKQRKRRKTACAHSRPKSSQLALAAAVVPRPNGKAKRAALAPCLKAALASTPADAVSALEQQWKTYVRKLAASGNSSSSSSSPSSSTLSALTLVGARARVAASNRESALVGRSGVVVAESRRAWHLYEREGKVSAVSKAGGELEVELVGGGGEGGDEEGEGDEGGGEEKEDRRRVVAVRVGGGAML